MSRIETGSSFVNWSDVSVLEEEINSKFANNAGYNIEEISIFAEVTRYSYYPIKTTVTDQGYIKIEDSINPIGLKLYVGSNRQFIHRRILMEEDSYKIELDEHFKTAWNPDKFIIFQNGYLMNSGLFSYVIPSFQNRYLKKMIYSTAKFKKDNRIDIYYVESDDNFSSLPISRDLYLGALKYTATKNNEKLIKIPYPYEDKQLPFFIFNEQGEYLDEGIDYITSYDKIYITLKTSLALATVDYIIFAFPQFSKDRDNVEFPQEAYERIVGSPYFKYCYSVPTDYNETGLVRFTPIYEDHFLTKKKFLLFGNGEWINPSRFEVHSNDAILFNNREDQEISSTINYTMVIFEDNTDHTNYNLPNDYFMVKIPVEEENQTVFHLDQNIGFEYKTFIIFKNNRIVTDYTFDVDSEKIKFNNPVNEDFYVIFFSSRVNNTNQEGLVYSDSFPCYTDGAYGTKIPEEYILNNLNSSFVLLFLNGKFLTPEEYEIKNGRIYLNTSFYTDSKGRILSLEGYTFSIVLLIGGFREDSTKLTDEEIAEVQAWQNNISYNYQETAYLFTRQSARSTEEGVIPFIDSFDRYKLNKRNMLLFTAGGVWVDQSRFELVDNDKAYLVYPYDHEASLYKSNYYAITFDDKQTDAQYSPPNVIIKHVTATRDGQSVFDIPIVHRRFRSFILFKGSILLNKEYNYVIEDETKVRFLNTEDFLDAGRSLTFVFIDAYSRYGQENMFIQSSFECRLNQATPLPQNFLHKRFNTDNIAIFLNGLYISPDKYIIHEDSILLDGFIELEELSPRIYTILYLTTIPIGLREYEYYIPRLSDIPVKENDIIPAAYLTHCYSTNEEGTIIEFKPPFEGYSIVKDNFLLFGDKHWIHPENYEVYSNDRLILNDNHYANLEMIIFDDSPVRTDLTNIPPSIKVIDVDVSGQIVKVPDVEDYYKSFIVFEKDTGILLDLVIKNEHNLFTDQIELSEYIYKPLSFVFLHSHMNEEQQMLFYQYSFAYEFNMKLPYSIYNADTMEKYCLVFKDGKYLPKSEYNIINGRLVPSDPIVLSDFRLNYTRSIEVLEKPNEEEQEEKTPKEFLLSYTYSLQPKEEKLVESDENVVEFLNFSYLYSMDSDMYNGKITFSSMTQSINKNNFMLFSNGLWVNPDRYNLDSNNQISFIDEADILHADWTHYSMVIPNERTAEEYVGPHYSELEIYQLTAKSKQQRSFNLPKLDRNATYLVFKGGLLVPESQITADYTTLRLNNDYVDKGRSLYLIVMKDVSSKDKLYSQFLQISLFPDADGSTSIPLEWYEYEDNMMVFLGGRYLDPSLFRIENHRIYLEDETIDVLSKSFTLIYLSMVEIFNSYTIEPQTITNGEVSFTPFEGYQLAKDNFMLFSNGLWVNPDRYEVYNNEKLIFTNLEDQLHADWTHYSMVIPNERTVEDIPIITSTDIQVYTLTATKDKQRVFDLPSFDRYYTYLVFKGGLLISNDRITIKNDQLYFNNRNDYIEKGRNAYLIKLTNPNIDDETYPTFLQITIKPTSNGTNIPMDWYDFEEGMMVYLGGRYLNPTMYKIINHRIYLEDETIDISNKSFTLVYLSPLPIGRYSYSVEPRTITNGKVTFTPFKNYTLTKNNFMLFGNGLWIHPDRYNIENNNKISFISEEDKANANSTFFNMAIFNNEVSKIEVYTLTATQTYQRIFDIPKFDNDCTYLVFKGGLLLSSDRVYIGGTSLRLNNDYIDQGRDLHLVVVKNTPNNWMYSKFLQTSFVYGSKQNGTVIPASWYKYEDSMMVFLSGLYLNPDSYRIEDHKIYMNDNVDYTSKVFTLVMFDKIEKQAVISIVYLLSLVPDLEDFNGTYNVSRPDEGMIDGFMFNYTYSIEPSSDEDDDDPKKKDFLNFQN